MTSTIKFMKINVLIRCLLGHDILHYKLWTVIIVETSFYTNIESPFNLQRPLHPLRSTFPFSPHPVMNDEEVWAVRVHGDKYSKHMRYNFSWKNRYLEVYVLTEPTAFTSRSMQVSLDE